LHINIDLFAIGASEPKALAVDGHTGMRLVNELLYQGRGLKKLGEAESFNLLTVVANDALSLRGPGHDGIIRREHNDSLRQVVRRNL
jgi:hypothetical protein